MKLRIIGQWKWTLPAILIAVCVSLGCARDTGKPTAIIGARQASDSDISPATKRAGVESRLFHQGDVVILRVIPGKEFEKELELSVNLQGEILVPLVGWVKIENLTAAQAEEKIRNLLNQDYIVNPRVSIRVKEAKSRAVVMLGELKKPGTYEFPPSGKMSLLEAVAKAEGFTDIADIEKVRIVRTMEDGSQQTIRVNARKIFGGEEPDIELKESDLITVPETLF